MISIRRRSPGRLPRLAAPTIHRDLPGALARHRVRTQVVSPAQPLPLNVPRSYEKVTAHLIGAGAGEDSVISARQVREVGGRAGIGGDLSAGEISRSIRDERR